MDVSAGRVADLTHDRQEAAQRGSAELIAGEAGLAVVRDTKEGAGALEVTTDSPA
jgi:hypothetical protein